MTEELWQVRLWDCMDGTWIDVGPERSEFHAKADAANRNLAAHGKIDAGFDDGDYYAAYPASSELHWSNGREMFR